MPEKMCKKKHLTSFQVIILGFAGVILLGSILLMLPVSSLDKVPTSFHEALFTATSAVCVTGLVVKESLDGGVTFLQLRDKNSDDETFLQEATELQELCRD